MHKGPVIQCAQCGGAIIAPEWSEHCGYRFENTVYFSAPKIQPDLRVEENEQAA
jgi:hypothetical protein